MRVASRERIRKRTRDQVELSTGEDPRILRRRAEVAEVTGRRRTRRLLVLAAVVTAAAVVWAVLQSPLADIDDVQVRGAGHVGDDAVRSASGLAAGQPLLALDGDAVAGVESLSWVREAIVERDLAGATVVITVVERVPVAAVGADGSWMLIDDEGVGLEAVEARPDTVIADGTSQVPMVEITGLEAPAPGARAGNDVRGALDVVAALPPGLATRIDGVRIDGEQLTLVLRPSGTVRFGRPEQINAKIRSLQAVLAKVDLTDLCAVDLRVPSSPVVDRSQPCA